jgi:hypothetical protein
VPSRIATDPVGDSGRLKALLLGDPSVIEVGIRVLDADLKTGPAGTLDVLAVDRAGQLAVITLADNEPEGALRRLLDQSLWAGDQYDILARAYASQGLSPERNVRSLLLAESYSFPFLRRLDLLAVEVTPYLVQLVRFKGEEAVTVRPAMEVFRLPSRRVAARVAAMREAMPRDVAAPLPAPPDLLEPVPEFPLADEPLPGDPVSGGGLDLEIDRLVMAPTGPDNPFEPLSAEELDEFERFDRQRRERDRRTS